MLCMLLAACSLLHPACYIVYVLIVSYRKHISAFIQPARGGSSIYSSSTPRRRGGTVPCTRVGVLVYSTVHLHDTPHRTGTAG